MFLRTQIKRMYLKGKTCVFVGKLIIQKVNYISKLMRYLCVIYDN